MKNTKRKRRKRLQGDRRFVRKARKQGKVVDFLGQIGGRYNYHIKYTPLSWAFKNETIIPNGWGGMDVDEANRIMVSMITPFIIKLDEVDKYKEKEGPITPITIQLSIDQPKIKDEEI